MVGTVADLDLTGRRRLHIVGIGGAGMSAIATVLAGMGHEVSGSDLKESRSLGRIALLGVTTSVGHDRAHVSADLDAVIVSTAIPASNPEVTAATESGVPVLRRADVLRAIVATRRGIAVAGTHGKTTTSSMLALMLRAAGWQPSFVIGGDLNEVGTNAALDAGEWLVVEADESDGTFLELPAQAVIVTNIEPDHLDHYGDFDALVDAFRRFVAAERTGPRVICADDPVARTLASDVGDAITYGWHKDADYRIDEYQTHRTGTSFTVTGRGQLLGTFALTVPGRHNALNAVGAAALALELGVGAAAVAAALAGYGGVARRFQYRGELDGVAVVDDYAHLPGEVSAAIETAREGEWERVVAVFQPHRYSRTARLWRDFGDAFHAADALVLTDVYGAGEVPQPGVSGRLVLRAVLDRHPAFPVTYLPRRADLVQHVPHLARPGDVILTLGAGDVTTLADEWIRSAPS
jgi:UDP-N-acetylmuramate--alanine ligase